MSTYSTSQAVTCYPTALSIPSMISELSCLSVSSPAVVPRNGARSVAAATTFIWRIGAHLHWRVHPEHLRTSVLYTAEVTSTAHSRILLFDIHACFACFTMHSSKPSQYPIYLRSSLSTLRSCSRVRNHKQTCPTLAHIAVVPTR
jgi:hypothetical protein